MSQRIEKNAEKVVADYLTINFRNLSEGIEENAGKPL
jgi:hypothetical protein